MKYHLLKICMMLATIACSSLANMTLADSSSSHFGYKCDKQPVGALPGPEGNSAVGSAQLCISRYGLNATVRIRNLVQGNAYTVWWVYIDDPVNDCSNDGVPGCDGFGGLEAFIPFENDPQSPAAVFGRMDSGVSHRGRMWFSDRLRSLKPKPGSILQLLVFGHGAADYSDGRHLARQLLTPEDPCSGFPHLGVFKEQLTPADCAVGLAGEGYPVAIAVFPVE